MMDRFITRKGAFSSPKALDPRFKTPAFSHLFLAGRFSPPSFSGLFARLKQGVRMPVAVNLPPGMKSRPDLPSGELMQVRWTRRALDNLDATVEYIVADNLAAAQDIAQKIWDSTRLLALQPGLGRLGRAAGTREMVITGLPFIIPDVEQNGVIVILRLMHTSMKWPDV